MRQKIVAGNWKMNKTLSEGLALASAIKEGLAKMQPAAKAVIAPPYPFISEVNSLLSGSGIKTAAQDCSAEEKGAFTGEVSAAMIKSCGADYVIIGHSERRMRYSEAGELLLKKVKQAFSNQLVPIFCIGETLAEREAKKQFDVVQ